MMAGQGFRHEARLLTVLSVAVFFGVAGIWWDGWWHVEQGRGSLWVAPHLVQYAAVLVLTLVGIILYRETRRKEYLRMLICQAIVMLMGPADEVWHRFFGAEDLTTPLAIWSPPHLVGAIGYLVAFTLIFKVLLQEWHTKTKGAFLRIGLVASAILSIMNFLVVPLQPFGWHFLLGQWGVIITVGTSLFFTLFLAYAFPNSGMTTFVTATLLIFIGFRGITPTEGILLPAHAIPPLWLNFFAILPAAIWLDSIDVRRTHPALLGAIAGASIYAIYLAFWGFIDAPPGFPDQIAAIPLAIMAAIGGVFAGVAIARAKLSPRTLSIG